MTFYWNECSVRRSLLEINSHFGIQLNAEQHFLSLEVFKIKNTTQKKRVNIVAITLLVDAIYFEDNHGTAT